MRANEGIDFDGDVDSADGDAMTACYSNGFASGDCNTVDYDDTRTIDIWDLIYFGTFSGLQRQPGNAGGPPRCRHPDRPLRLCHLHYFPAAL